MDYSNGTVNVKSKIFNLLYGHVTSKLHGVNIQLIKTD